MKKSIAIVAFSELVKLGQAANVSPKLFSLPVKLAIAENIRKLGPINEAFQAERNELIKHYGTASKTVPGAFEVKDTSSKFAAFTKAINKATEGAVDVKLRTFSVNNLRDDTPIEVDTLLVLEQAGILKDA